VKKYQLLVFTCVYLFLATSTIFAQETVKEGKTVRFDYTLKVEDQAIESSEGKKPIEYVHGVGKIIPGLANALEGMKEGDTKSVKIEPEDAYGEIIEDAIKDVPKDNFPEDFTFEVGTVIQLQDPEGNNYPGVVWEVKDDSVVVNFNHPLAGQSLTFDVEIISIN